MTDIDLILKSYEPGLPKMKPGVLKQIKKIEEDHKKIVEEHMKSQQNGGGSGGQIMLERPGESPIVLSSQDVVNIIKQQQLQIEQLTKRVTDMNEIIQKMQEKIVQMRNTEKDLRDELKNKSQDVIQDSTKTENIVETPILPVPPVEEKIEIKLNKSEPEIKVQLKKR